MLQQVELSHLSCPFLRPTKPRLLLRSSWILFTVAAMMMTWQWLHSWQPLSLFCPCFEPKKNGGTDKQWKQLETRDESGLIQKWDRDANKHNRLIQMGGKGGLNTPQTQTTKTKKKKNDVQQRSKSSSSALTLLYCCIPLLLRFFAIDSYYYYYYYYVSSIFSLVVHSHLVAFVLVKDCFYCSILLLLLYYL